MSYNKNLKQVSFQGISYIAKRRKTTHRGADNS